MGIRVAREAMPSGSDEGCFSPTFLAGAVLELPGLSWSQPSEAGPSCQQAACAGHSTALARDSKWALVGQTALCLESRTGGTQASVSNRCGLISGK